MTLRARLAMPLTVAAAWTTAGSTVLPLPASAAVAALCILALPGVCIERLLSGGPTPYGAGSAPARWLTFSVALIALLGLVVSTVGGNIHALLLSIAGVSIGLAACPAPDALGSGNADTDRTRSDAGERLARAALVILVVVSVLLAAAAANVARDRMWYIAFVARLASGTPIDWVEPFLGTGAVAARFAYNGWLLALAAWSSLTGASPSLVFERLAPPVLTVAAASAAWHFGRCAVPAAPGLAALASLSAMLATRFPFFSPDRYPFFARVAEDKSVALLVLAPVTLVAVADAVAANERKSSTVWASLVLCLIAVAFGHALVMFLVGIAVAFLLVTSSVFGAANRVSARRVAAALALAAVVAVIPGRMAVMARDNIIDVKEPASAWSQDVMNPVVRAHLRLERTRDLPVGGPIVEPMLVADPLLLAGLAGIVVAWRRRRDVGGALLAATSVPFVALAFMPFVAPIFGRIVLPWMAYRALWLIPFGSLVALLLTALPRGSTTTVVRSAAALVLLATTLSVLPWDRSSARQEVVAPLRDRDTREVLARIATLPSDARIAAAPGFAELIPALAGRAAVAVADRGTFVFAGSQSAAETRLRAATALVALAPGSPRFRLEQAHRGGATHFVLHGHRCGRVGREVFRSGPLRLCTVVASPQGADRAGTASMAAAVDPTSALATTVRAALGSGITCSPTPQSEQTSDNGEVHEWKRKSRWTAKPVAIRCRVKMTPSAGDLVLTVAAELPRARETIVLRAVARTGDGPTLVRHALVPLEGNHTAAILLRVANARALQLRIAPAYLPYLNLRELALRERDAVGE